MVSLVPWNVRLGWRLVGWLGGGGVGWVGWVIADTSVVWHSPAHVWRTSHCTLETATLTQTQSQEVFDLCPLQSPFFYLPTMEEEEEEEEEGIQTSARMRSRRDACYQTKQSVI